MHTQVIVKNKGYVTTTDVFLRNISFKQIRNILGSKCWILKKR